MRVAHLSDLHVLEARRRVGDGYTWRTHLVSYARALDAEKRAAKLRRSLVAAHDGGASHVVISGDLTEMGSDAQFEALAEQLHDSPITPERITLVPGNHDAYSAPDAWRRALEGPLRAFAEASASTPGVVVEREDVIFLPVDVSCFQSIARAGGTLTDATADALEARLRDPSIAKKPVALVQHHPPFAPTGRFTAWVDGLRGSARLGELLQRHVNVNLFHGHLHRIADYLFGNTRVFAAPAVVDDRDAARVRFYDLKNGIFQAA